MPDINAGREALEYRKRYRGVIGVSPKIPIKDTKILSLVYTPGVAAPCMAIARDPAQSYLLSCRGNTVGILTDGSGLFRLGHAGPEAALPVMEGKSVIFKTFAGIDALPICLRTKDPYEFIDTALALSSTFGAFCLEDIASPQSFTITDHLGRGANIPVFNNHGIGVAITVLAALINSMKVVGKDLLNARVVINGAGMAGLASADLLIKAGIKQVVVCDRDGALYKYRLKGMNWIKEEMSQQTNPEKITGDLANAVKGCDVFIGLSVAGALSKAMISTMAEAPVIFALANPTPEILPDAAKEAGALIVATGRSDFPNQVNNSLVFPGVFRGALDVRARTINEEMKIAAARTIAELVSDKELRPEYIIPRGMDFKVPPAVAAAVARAARKTGVAKIEVDPESIAQRTRTLIYEGEPGYRTKEGVT